MVWVRNSMFKGSPVCAIAISETQPSPDWRKRPFDVSNEFSLGMHRKKAFVIDGEIYTTIESAKQAYADYSRKMRKVAA